MPYLLPWSAVNPPTASSQKSQTYERSDTTFMIDPFTPQSAIISGEQASGEKPPPPCSKAPSRGRDIGKTNLRHKAGFAFLPLYRETEAPKSREPVLALCPL